MKIVFKKSVNGSYDGSHVQEYKEGETYTVGGGAMPYSLAEVFLGDGSAAEVEDDGTKNRDGSPKTNPDGSALAPQTTLANNADAKVAPTTTAGAAGPSEQKDPQKTTGAAPFGSGLFANDDASKNGKTNGKKNGGE